jgi:hypothetical protein
MKLVKNLALAGLLVLSLSMSIFAGEQPTMNATQPPPPPTPDDVRVYTEGISPLGDPYTGDITAETTDYLFFEALVALLSVY